MILMVLGFLGLILRWTIRDRWPIVATLFYGLPPLVALVYLALSTGLFIWLRKRRWAIVTLVGTAIGAFVWIQSDYIGSTVPNHAGEGFRIALWNISDPEVVSPTLLSTLTQADAQIMVLAESGGADEEKQQFWTSHFPDYHLSALGGGVTLLSKFPISQATMKTMGTRTYIPVYDLETPFGIISVVVADIISNPFVPRKAYIDRVYELAVAQPYPTIVLGDFNTPHTSVFFRDFRRTFQHAFETSGHGFKTTWLAVLPVLALDHIWLSKEFTPLHTRIKRTFCSDHAMVVTEVRLDPSRNPVRESEFYAHD